MSGVFPEDDWDPYEGWNRASLIFRSRKPYHPKTTPADLLMPSGRGNPRMFGMCALMAVCLTVLYLSFPLFTLSIFVPIGGAIFGAIIAGTALTFTALLYVLGTRETRRDREYAAQL